MQVIMISGKSASGKDTFANFLRENLEAENKKVLIIHFADLVKTFAKQYYNWNGEKDEEGRRLLQTIGTHKLRRYFPTYWGEVVSKFIAAVQDDFDYAIIPDWRFINELETVDMYNKNITTIRINRYENGQEYLNPNMNEKQSHHISEYQLDDFNFEWIIDNIGDLDDLRFNANVIASYLI